jgi:hypothetical protein
VNVIDALPFARVVTCDFEFGGDPGERPDVRCFVGRELRSGRTSTLWRSDIGAKSPFPTDQNTLYVAYYASAEINCFLSLGWPLPFYMLDLFTEFRCITNGLDPVAGNGLLGALTYFGLDTVGAGEKKEMRDLALRGGPYTRTEIRHLLAYCEGDTDALERLLPRMLPYIRLDHAMARTHPQLAKVHELRASLSKLRLNDLQVGKDGRNRVILSAFRARTGRNQPSNSKSIVGPARWIRGFIQPPEGYGLAYIDYSQQEFGIAAALSGDGNMIDAYTDSRADPYLRFGILAGMLPEDATRKNLQHESVRNLCKTLVLAIQYGQSAEGMAQRTGMSVVLARDLMRRHRMTFPTFWRWSDRAVRQAALHNILHTVFGWPIHIVAEFNPRSLRNFPMQANGAEMLRLACCLATERGIEVCMPVHDATFITAPLDRIDEDIARMQACMQERCAWWVRVAIGCASRALAQPLHG